MQVLPALLWCFLGGKMIDKIRKQWETIVYTLRIIYRVDKKLFLSVGFLSIVGGGFPVLSLIITQRILNTIQLLEGTITYLTKLILIYIGLSLLSCILQSISSYLGIKLSNRLTYDVNYMLMEKCSELSLKQLEDPETYDMISRLEGEVSIKPFLALESFINIVYAMVTYVVAMIILFTWKPFLFLMFLLVSIFFFVYYIKIGHKEFLMRFNRSEEERQAWYYTHLLTHDTGFKEIKTLHLGNYFLRKYRMLIDKFIKQELKINKTKISLSTIVTILENILSFFVMFIAMQEAYNGTILIGTALVYMNVVGYIESNTSTMAANVYNIYTCNLYMKLLMDFFELPVKKSVDLKRINEITEMEIKDLCFGYPQHHNVLENISIDIHKGECVAVVGKNGSGKSTLLKLLCGLYNYDSGEIYVNNIPLVDIDPASYCKQISVLFQDFLKFEGSLEENIRIGDVSEKSVTKEDIYAALVKADVDFFREEGSYTYNRTLGNWFSGGTQISGGQWQKIALARAYFKKASVYLLDEPSSSLDVMAEMKIFDSFFEYCKDHIGVYITHRFKIAQKASKIVMIDNGKIMGIGSHEYLFNNCSLYNELYLKEQEI